MLFKTPFDQYRIHHSKTCMVLREINAKTDPGRIDPEVGSLFIIRFQDGTEIEAWPEEIHPESDHVGLSSHSTQR